MMTWRTLIVVMLLLVPGPSGMAEGNEPMDPSVTTPAPEVLRREAERIRVIERITPPTIAIFDQSGAGGGSGVLISRDGYALSNFHVTQPSGHFMKCGLASGELVDAVIVGVDPTGDVALIKLLGRDDFPAAELGDSDTLQPGQWCIAAGNPFLLATDFRPTISYGMVSGVNRYQYPSGTLLEYTDCIQIDAAVNPGNSGGPLFDESGKLVGINSRCSFEKRGRVNVGVAYAISINQIKNFLGFLKSGRIVDHATLGATVSSDEEGRVIVTNIIEDSDAYRRGLRIDDQIIALGGRPVNSVNAVKNIIGIFPRGWRLPVSFMREGKRMDILVRLPGVHATEELLSLLEEPKQPMAPPDDPGPKQPGDEGQGPRPAPSPLKEIESPVAESVNDLYIPRRGFANYYFNKLRIDQVLNAWRQTMNVDGLTGEWLLSGTLASGDKFELSLRDEEALLITNLGHHRADLGRDLDVQLEPEGSGGMLLALSMWRRLAILGPEQFGQVVYLGTAPRYGKEQFDVFVATFQSVEMHCYFRPSDATLQAIELYTRDDRDPCEITFDRYQEFAGRWLPTEWTVTFGGRHFDTLEIQSVHLPEGSGSNETPSLDPPADGS